MIPWSSLLRTHGATRVRSTRDDTYTGRLYNDTRRTRKACTHVSTIYERACVRARLPVVEDIGEPETSGTIPSRRRLIMGRQFLALFKGYIIYAPKLPRREIRVFQTRKSRWMGMIPSPSFVAIAFGNRLALILECYRYVNFMYKRDHRALSSMPSVVIRRSLSNLPC